MVFNIAKVLSPVVAALLLVTAACGESDSTESQQDDSAPTASLEVESTQSSDLTIPAEVAFAAQIANLF